jgi:hypothetical protein
MVNCRFFTHKCWLVAERFYLGRDENNNNNNDDDDDDDSHRKQFHRRHVRHAISTYPRRRLSSAYPKCRPINIACVLPISSSSSSTTTTIDITLLFRSDYLIFRCCDRHTCGNTVSGNRFFFHPFFIRLEWSKGKQCIVIWSEMRSIGTEI